MSQNFRQHRSIVIPKGTVSPDKITVVRIPVTTPQNNTPLVVINKSQLYSPNLKKSDVLQFNKTGVVDKTKNTQTSNVECQDCQPCTDYPSTSFVPQNCGSQVANQNTYPQPVQESNPPIRDTNIKRQLFCSDKLEDNSKKKSSCPCDDPLVSEEPPCPCDPGAACNNTFDTNQYDGGYSQLNDTSPPAAPFAPPTNNFSLCPSTDDPAFIQRYGPFPSESNGGPAMKLPANIEPRKAPILSVNRGTVYDPVNTTVTKNRTSVKLSINRPYVPPAEFPRRLKRPKRPEINYLPCPSVKFDEEEPQEEEEPAMETRPDPNMKIAAMNYRQYSQTNAGAVEGMTFIFDDPYRQGVSEIVLGQLARSTLEEPPPEVGVKKTIPTMCTDQRNLLDNLQQNATVTEVIVLEVDDEDCKC